jgi:Protein of unknown function (DUF4238)
VSSIIRDILKDTTLPTYNSDTFSDLLLFVLLQHSRTRYAVDEHDETIKKMEEIVLGGAPEAMLPPQLSEKINNVPRLLMQVTTNLAWAGRDLRAKLLVNRTSHPYITSDNPVVFYNQLLRVKRVPGGRTGIGCRGIQIFIPLNPRVMLHLFDGDVYFVGGKRHSNQLVEVARPNDISQLNELQAVNANCNLYFNDEVPESYIKQLLRHAAKYRWSDKVVVEEFPSAELSVLPQGSLVVSHRQEINLPLDLSFLRISHAGRTYDPRGKPVHMRDDRMLHVIEKPMIRHLQERLLGKQVAGIYAKKTGAGWADIVDNQA